MEDGYKLVVVLNFLLFLLFRQSQYAAGAHTSLCIRLPKESFPDSTYKPSGLPPMSVGMEKFPQNIWKKYYYALHGDGSDPGYKHPELNYAFAFKGAQQFDINLHPVLGRIEPLVGWYGVELIFKANGPFDEIVRSFILMATDEQYNPIGEFVTTEDMAGSVGATCAANDATKYMIIPCGGVSKYEPTVSNVIVWASRTINTYDNQYGEHGPIVPAYKEKTLTFYYRFSMQDGNRNWQKYIVFRLLADLNEDYDWFNKEQTISDGEEKGLFSSISWFSLRTGHVPGATDPLLTNTESRDCTLPLIRQRPDQVNTRQWFIQRFSNEISADKREYQHSREHWVDHVLKYTGCSSAQFYGGRCVHTQCESNNNPRDMRPNPSGEIPRWHSTKTTNCPTCAGPDAFPWDCVVDVADEPKKYNNEDTTFPECLDGYSLTFSKSGCTTNLTKEDVRKIVITVLRKARGNETIITPGVTVTVNDTLKRINTRGVRGVGFGTLLYALRKGHGVLMVVVAMFFVPVICFTSRYFKETFMDSRILLARIWFQLHIQSVFWIVAFYLGGMLLAFAGRALLGVSLTIAGLSHRVLGWMTIVLFIILAVSGPIRLIDDPGRSCTIGTHWVLGYLFYFLNIVSIISSVHIPGCPISDHDESIIRDRDEFTVYKAFVILTLWMVIELVLGVIMTIHIHSHDHDMMVEGPRKYFPGFIGAAIPVLRENSHVDAAGFTCRHLIFYVYIGLALLAAILMSGSMIANKMTPFKGYGPMWCTHDEDTLSLLSGIRPECR
ncbi:Ferric-chelate reductase 1 [Orchesella cincta]|uniref:Ferric-chelate reductase 1 n=1 Tax=Orchesella cincta TaxID=48709 RepID=A0A1D2NGG7_ORCCI|nr:Ferric-chelate reductase 1 [Orchesella cincta]